MILNLEGIAGEDIKDCCYTAARIATMLNLKVYFKADGDDIEAIPGDCADETYRRYEKRVK